MANTITQEDIMNSLHNLMGHRVAPGGVEDDYKRYIQSSFEYCWRYYKWGFSLKKATVDVDGLLPTDFDYEGYREFDGITEVDLATTLTSATAGSALIWDDTTQRYKLEPASACTVVYQYSPPTLDDGVAVPFPSAQIVALGATVYAKQADNPTRADITQEWDTFHSELDRLVGRADFAKRRRPVHYLDAAGTYVGDVGA